MINLSIIFFNISFRSSNKQPKVKQAVLNRNLKPLLETNRSKANPTTDIFKLKAK